MNISRILRCAFLILIIFIVNTTDTNAQFLDKLKKRVKMMNLQQLSLKATTILSLLKMLTLTKLRSRKKNQKPKPKKK